MTTTTDSTKTAANEVQVAKADLKLEVVVIPVADPDRSRAFYEALGWRLDADFAFDNGFRVVQFTPPGSGTSIQFGSLRSEERRVGKECRSRWSPYH